MVTEELQPTGAMSVEELFDEAAAEVVREHPDWQDWQEKASLAGDAAMLQCNHPIAITAPLDDTWHRHA